MVTFTSWDIGQYVYCSCLLYLYCKCLLTRLWRYFEINLIFLIKPFFLYDEKEKTKTLNILRTKRAFKIKWIAFFIIFEALSLRQIEKNGRWEPDFNRKSFATIKFYVKEHRCELLIKLYKKKMTNHGTNDVQRVLQTTT